MIIDSSAIVAILRQEPGCMSLAKAIDRATHCRMSAVNYVEAAIIADQTKDPIASRDFDTVLKEARIIIEEVTEQQSQIARNAYRDFGKGSGHPARLNFGDCFAYALAKVKGEPLLFKGNDFIHTDIAVVTLD